jgi:hypothetical protein
VRAEKPKPARIGDEVRQEWGFDLMFRSAELDESQAHSVQ